MVEQPFVVPEIEICLRAAARCLACARDDGGRDDTGGSRWQCLTSCLSIASKFLRRLERADGGVSVFGAKNSFLRGDRMGVTADAAAILSCRLINTRTTLLIFSMSLLSRRKAADTGAVKKCTAKMRRTKS